jgi:hypothetical protein
MVWTHPEIELVAVEAINSEESRSDEYVACFSSGEYVACFSAHAGVARFSAHEYVACVSAHAYVACYSAFATPPNKTSAERVLPHGVDYFDAHIWSMVRATDSGIIIPATSPGPSGFVVGKFEGFVGGPYIIVRGA